MKVERTGDSIFIYINKLMQEVGMVKENTIIAHQEQFYDYYGF